MERPYESGMNDTAIFFTGIEVEKSNYIEAEEISVLKSWWVSPSKWHRS